MDVNNDNSFAAGGVLIKTKILSFVLKQKPSTPPKNNFHFLVANSMSSSLI